MPGSEKETVLLVGENMFFLGRVEALADPLGYEVLRASTESAFWASYGNRQPALILVDLEGEESVWSRVLEGLGQQESGKIKVVAFGPHEDVALLERARVLGCDLALSRAEFNRDLLNILLALDKKSN